MAGTHRRYSVAISGWEKFRALSKIITFSHMSIGVLIKILLNNRIKKIP
jgi:hypothetical protein